QMIPGIGLIIPLYVLLADVPILGFNLVNKLTGVMVVYISAVLPFSVWTLRGFLMGIPKELEDAAMVDGSSWLGAGVVILLESGGLLVLRSQDPAPRARGHGRSRSARLLGRPPHVLRERLRLLPRHDGGDRRGLAGGGADGPGEPLGPRSHVRRRGREPLGRV